MQRRRLVRDQAAPAVTLYQTLREVLDARSFASIWYWIVVTVAWSSASHWVVGVPFDIIVRARREGGEAMSDLEDILRVNVRRILYVSQRGAAGLAGFTGFVVAGLATMAIWYQIEFAQAVLLILVPMIGVGLMTLRFARRLVELNPEGLAIVRLLMRHRFKTQLIGMAAIFVTAIFGMWRNFVHLPMW